jgi:hypothetical protein
LGKAGSARSSRCRRLGCCKLQTGLKTGPHSSHDTNSTLNVVKSGSNCGSNQPSECKSHDCYLSPSSLEVRSSAPLNQRDLAPATAQPLLDDTALLGLVVGTSFSSTRTYHRALAHDRPFAAQRDLPHDCQQPSALLLLLSCPPFSLSYRASTLLAK